LISNDGIPTARKINIEAIQTNNQEIQHTIREFSSNDAEISISTTS